MLRSVHSLPAAVPCGAAVAAVSAEQALPLYRHYLRQLLSEVLRGLAGQPPGPARLQRLLQLSWDASLRGRALHAAALQSAVGTPHEARLEPLGAPFLRLLQIELQQLGCIEVTALAGEVALCARHIALHEARSGRPAPPWREGLLHCLLEAALD